MSSTLDIYKVALGHNAIDGLLVPVYPQPRSDPASPVDRKFGLTGKVHDEGLFVEIYWDYIEYEQEYWDLLAQFGVNVNPSASITYYGRDSRFVFRKFNGIAQLPEGKTDVKRSNYFIRDVVMRITHLEQL